MGLSIKRNKVGDYQLVSTISDERLHDEEWISENEAKRILIHRQFWKFIESAIEIDMTFPNGYSVNDKHHYDKNKPDYNRFIIDAYKSKDVDNIINEKFEEINKRLSLDIKI